MENNDDHIPSISNCKLVDNIHDVHVFSNSTEDGDEDENNNDDHEHEDGPTIV